MSVVKKKKHVSKKNKKAWRKYCDIRDVEDFLEDQRLEERLGKFETKPDNELFVVDTIGEDAKVEEKPLSGKQKRRAKLAEPPKCFNVFIPSSKVPDPKIKRNPVNPVGSKPTALSKITEKRRLDRGIYQKKVEVARKNRRLALEKKRKNKQIRHNFDKDIWSKDSFEAKGIPSTLCKEFISPEAKLHNVLPEARFRAKPPPPKTVVTRAPVETPHPGVSYNPSFQEHQELLHQVVEHEQKMIKREKHLSRVTTGMFNKVTPQQKENQWREEMSEGLPQPHNPANEPSAPESDTDNEYKPVNPPVKNKKKDHKTRRKQKERLEEIEKLKREKIDKKKITDIYRLRKLETSITKTEQKQAKLRSKRATKRAVEETTAVPKLNANKPPVKEPDFVEPQQLTGDLRQISTTTNLLRERYESLQHRGALAGAKLMMKKKRKVKSYFKQGHKVTEKDIERYLKKPSGAKGPTAGL